MTYDPKLPMSRVASLSNWAVDGFTLLHVAASYNSIKMLSLFQEIGDKDVRVCLYMCIFYL